MEFINQLRVGKCALIRIVLIPTEADECEERYDRLKWTSKTARTFWPTYYVR